MLTASLISVFAEMNWCHNNSLCDGSLNIYRQQANSIQDEINRLAERRDYLDERWSELKGECARLQRAYQQSLSAPPATPAEPATSPSRLPNVPPSPAVSTPPYRPPSVADAEATPRPPYRTPSVAAAATPPYRPPSVAAAVPSPAYKPPSVATSSAAAATPLRPSRPVGSALSKCQCPFTHSSKYPQCSRSSTASEQLCQVCTEASNLIDNDKISPELKFYLGYVRAAYVVDNTRVKPVTGSIMSKKPSRTEKLDRRTGETEIIPSYPEIKAEEKRIDPKFDWDKAEAEMLKMYRENDQLVYELIYQIKCRDKDKKCHCPLIHGWIYPECRRNGADNPEKMCSVCWKALQEYPTLSDKVKDFLANVESADELNKNLDNPAISDLAKSDPQLVYELFYRIKNETDPESLRVAPNPTIPGRYKPKKEAQDEKILSDIQLILNQIQASNLGDKIHDIESLLKKIDIPSAFSDVFSDVFLDNVASKIHSTVISIRTNLNLYAEVVRAIDERYKGFKTSVIEKCQKFYEHRLVRLENVSQIENKEERDEQTTILATDQGTNLKFLAELYKQGLTPAKLPYKILADLLHASPDCSDDNKPSSLDLRLVVAFLSAKANPKNREEPMFWQILNRQDGKDLAKYFGCLENLSKDKSYDSAIRFSVMDLLDEWRKGNPKKGGNSGKQNDSWLGRARRLFHGDDLTQDADDSSETKFSDISSEE